MSVRARSFFSTPILPYTARKPLRNILSVTPLVPRCQVGDWTGTKVEDHGLNRVKWGDATDPQTEAMKSGLDERSSAEKTTEKDKAKSQATTERHKTRAEEVTEEEYPEAPKPIIGMNDERGRKGA